MANMDATKTREAVMRNGDKKRWWADDCCQHCDNLNAPTAKCFGCNNGSKWRPETERKSISKQSDGADLLSSLFC